MMKKILELLRFLLAVPFLLAAVTCYAVAFVIDADSTLRVYISPLPRILQILKRNSA